jgi:hypothetical protein
VVIPGAMKDGVRGFVDEGFEHLGAVTRVDDDDLPGPGLKRAVGRDEIASLRCDV